MVWVVVQAEVIAAMARRLSLAQARSICDGIVSACESRGFAPLSMVVLDADGHAVVSQRMDGCCPAAFPDFALAKAYTR